MTLLLFIGVALFFIRQRRRVLAERGLLGMKRRIMTASRNYMVRV
jgi:hypothetical protein